MIAYGISTVYNLLLAYSLVFLYESFSSPLPWTVGYEDGGFNRVREHELCCVGLFIRSYFNNTD